MTILKTAKSLPKLGRRLSRDDLVEELRSLQRPKNYSISLLSFFFDNEEPTDGVYYLVVKSYRNFKHACVVKVLVNQNQMRVSPMPRFISSHSEGTVSWSENRFDFDGISNIWNITAAIARDLTLENGVDLQPHLFSFFVNTFVEKVIQAKNENNFVIRQEEGSKLIKSFSNYVLQGVEEHRNSKQNIENFVYGKDLKVRFGNFKDAKQIGIKSNLAMPILGYRVWRIEDGLLRGITVTSIWENSAPTQAFHSDKFGVCKEKMESCICGLYGVYDLNNALYLLADRCLPEPGYVVGAFIGWGKIVLSAHGFRSEKARPIALLGFEEALELSKHNFKWPDWEDMKKVKMEISIEDINDTASQTYLAAKNYGIPVLGESIQTYAQEFGELPLLAN
jgi:hypothetical protein